MAWTEVAPQATGVPEVRALAIFGGELYGSGTDCDLLKWNGTNAWTSVFSGTLNWTTRWMVPYNGKIYAALHLVGFPNTVARLYHSGTLAGWASTAPSLPSTAIAPCLQIAGTRLFVFFIQSGVWYLAEDVSAAAYTQRSAGSANEATVGSINCMAYFNNEIWGGTSAGYLLHAGLNGTTGTSLTETAALSNKSITSMTVHNSKLYVGTDNGALYEWSGTALVEVAPSLDNGETITSLLPFNTDLYAGLSQF
jgi:ligand-binding sensor domain-containing protein